MSSDDRPKFTWLGHATVRCDLPDGRVLLVDPWVAGNPACPDSAKRLERLDAVLITHAHFDHMADAVELCRRFSPVVVANFEICAWLGKHGVANCSGMNLGGTQEVLGLKVTMVRADHSSGFVEDGVPVYGGLACGYMVRMPGGPTVYFAGDTALYSDMELIGELYRPELGFLPIGDHFTMDPAQAARACRYLGLRRVAPVHWGTFPILHGRPAQLREALATFGTSCEVVDLAPGESF